MAVGHVWEDCFDYSPNNPKPTPGSGLLGTGARGRAADKRWTNPEQVRRNHMNSVCAGMHTGA